jgi:hypothetical protein
VSPNNGIVVVGKWQKTQGGLLDGVSFLKKGFINGFLVGM